MKQPQAKAEFINSQSNCHHRSKNGMALASVLAFGIVITLFVTVLLDTMLPVLQKTAQFKSAGTARSYADLGLDYAIQQLNGGTLNCSSSDGAFVNWDVPSTVINDPSATVNVTVSALSSLATAGTGNPPNTSILYDPLLNAQSQYAYRMVTVTSTYGLAVKQLRCLLEPLATTTGGTPQMPYGVFGVSSVSYAGQAGYSTYNSADPRVNSDTATLGKISQVYGGTHNLPRSIVEGGSHYNFLDPQSYYNQQFNIAAPGNPATPSGSAPWMTIGGNVYSNGDNSAYYAATGTGDTMTSSNPMTWTNNSSQAAHNVLGISNGISPSNTIPTGISNAYVPQANPPQWTGGIANWNVGPTNADGVTYPQPTISTTPSAPAGAINLGNINLNNAKIIIDESAPAPTGPIGTLSAGQSISIPPGSYTINSLSMTNNSSIQFARGTQTDISAGSAAPTSMFVSGTNNGAIVVSVDNTSSVNMSGITMGNPVGSNLNNGFNTAGDIGVLNSRGTSVLPTTQLAITPPGGNGLVTEAQGSAGQFQLYYAGSSFNSTNNSYNTQIILSGNQRMTVYAPNAGILVGSPSVTAGSGPSPIANNTNFFGSIVGASVGINSGYNSGGGVFMHYDANLRPSTMKWIDPWQPPPTLMGGSFSGYRAVTWQEAIQTNLQNPSQAQWTYQ